MLAKSAAMFLLFLIRVASLKTGCGQRSRLTLPVESMYTSEVFVFRQPLYNNVTAVEELHLVISSSVNKFLAEPHYCETYADLVAELLQRMPAINSATNTSHVSHVSIDKSCFLIINVSCCLNVFQAASL